MNKQVTIKLFAALSASLAAMVEAFLAHGSSCQSERNIPFRLTGVACDVSSALFLRSPSSLRKIRIYLTVQQISFDVEGHFHDVAQQRR
ncbi:hypothetical protein [Brucella pseudogrignonensis]|uniref:Secreted protein n=1 Tax=Brucella pseudogrignonensis TaxID=419475 RepID=A0ABU1MBC0_9HYPH|nr:hypothetical protein [Brucella pseudogrignonensis]MDR6433358.1 hypothetical protein [Brucella pseudogrignonensis]